jgi:adenylate cyclase
MGYEIERKFLVKDKFKHLAHEKKHLIQGYLCTNPEKTIRIRIEDHLGFITIKGKTNDSGTTRFEWEKEIDLQDAKSLLELSEHIIIEKYRYLVKNGKHIFEVDEFLGENKGLVVAEIELDSEDEVFDKPCWLGEEVTGQPRYHNSMLSKKSFRQW